MVKILAMSDETFREINGYVPKYNEPESNARLVFAPVFAVLGALLVTNGQMSSIVTIFLPAQWLIQQDAERNFIAIIPFGLALHCRRGFMRGGADR